MVAILRRLLIGGGNPMLLDRIEREKEILTLMVSIYCRRKERNPELCPGCRALLDYAFTRLDKCPFGNSKKSCRRCPIHCYSPQMKRAVRTVMRYSGPRMLLYHPIETLRHL